MSKVNFASQAQTSSGSAYAQDDRLEGCKVLTHSLLTFWFSLMYEETHNTHSFAFFLLTFSFAKEKVSSFAYFSFLKEK